MSDGFALEDSSNFITQIKFNSLKFRLSEGPPETPNPILL